MPVHKIQVERFSVVSSRSFDDVVAILDQEIASYGSPEALRVARDLDSKIEGLLTAAAG